MDQKQEPLDYLFGLVSEREKVNTKITDEITELLYPTAIAAVEEVLEADDKQLKVISIDVFMDDIEVREKTTILITCLLSYEAEDQIPDLVRHISPILHIDENPLQRLVRVAIPFSFAFQDKEIIKDMLYRMLMTDINGDEDIISGIEDIITEKPSNVVSLIEYHERQNKGKIH